MPDLLGRRDVVRGARKQEDRTIDRWQVHPFAAPGQCTASQFVVDEQVIDLGTRFQQLESRQLALPSLHAADGPHGRIPPSPVLAVLDAHASIGAQANWVAILVGRLWGP